MHYEMRHVLNVHNRFSVEYAERDRVEQLARRTAIRMATFKVAKNVPLSLKSIKRYLMEAAISLI